MAAGHARLLYVEALVWLLGWVMAVVVPEVVIEESQETWQVRVGSGSWRGSLMICASRGFCWWRSGQ